MESTGKPDVISMLLAKLLPSRQILVPRTSRGRPPPTSPGRSLKTLKHSNLTSWGLLEMTSKGRPWEVYSGRPLDDLENTS